MKTMSRLEWALCLVIFALVVIVLFLLGAVGWPL